jgi:hydroxyacyl-ACP dehydratase HTD2-like protein with hotdog domain
MTDLAASWLGRRELAGDICALPLVRRLAALLDHDPAALRQGDLLPHGWHMILFTPETPQSGLGPDGHPSGAGFLPPPPLPRRVLGGRRTRFLAQVRIGAEVRRISEVVDFQEKAGRSGRLVVVTVRHSIHEGDNSEPAVVEEQDIIYREPAASPKGAAADEVESHPEPTHVRSLVPDPVMLFRYSAVTFNGHRIHYDRPYATQIEGYPGPVVNGGLTALLLLELGKQASGRPPKEMTARNRRLLICGRPIRLCAAVSDDGCTLWAENEAGQIALEASIR